MAKAKRNFAQLFASYRTYDPETEGYGSPAQWRESFRVQMGLDEAREVLGARSPREVLGVAATATWREIVKAFRALVLRVHPDRIATSGLGIEEATRRTKEANAAFAVLAAER